MTNYENTQLLLKLKRENCDFGTALRSVRKSHALSLRGLAHEISKTPAYISDVECGNTRPPNRELLEEILSALSLTDNGDPLRSYLFDLAARQRGEAPGDILNYIMEHDELRNTIRLAVQKETGDEFWAKCTANL